MTIGERIKSLRESKRITQTELAEKLGTTKQNIYKYENGIITNIPSDKIELMAKCFEVSPGYIMGWEDEDKKQIKGAVPFYPQDMVPIPVIGRVAAGYTCLAETDIECYELVNPEMLNDGYEYAYLKVIGDSMEPLLLEGDMVLVRIQETVESGDYAVVIVDDEDGLVKQVEIDSDCVRLISQNPYYPPREFKGRNKNRLRIFGKVVESKRKFL